MTVFRGISLNWTDETSCELDVQNLLPQTRGLKRKNSAVCKLSYSSTQNGNVPKRTSLRRRRSLTWITMAPNLSTFPEIHRHRDWVTAQVLLRYLWRKSVSVCRSIMYYRRSSFGNEPAQTLIIVETAANSTGTVDCFSLQKAGNRSHTQKKIYVLIRYDGGSVIRISRGSLCPFTNKKTPGTRWTTLLCHVRFPFPHSLYAYR